METPTTCSFSFWFKIPAFCKITFSIPQSLASENFCLQIIDSIIDTVVITDQYNGVISLLIERLGKQTEIHVLSHPKSVEQDIKINSTITEDLLQWYISVIPMDARFINFTNIIISKIDPLIHKIEVLDFTKYANMLPLTIIKNKFQPLGKCKTFGKDYRIVNYEQQNLFSDSNINSEQPLQRIRKAYSRTQYPPFVKKQDFWDLIFPLLQPSLILDFHKEFDFYQPLYSYQKQGIEQFVKNTSFLLADEMGTGKTVQAIIALRILFRQAKVKQALIICPAAIIGSAYLSQITGKPEGWDGHFYKWAPELTVTVVRGNKEQRTLDWTSPAHVYISSFETLRNDLDNNILKEQDIRKFDCVIVDEAQNIKNRNSGKSRAVRKFTPTFRWALTGTPIENRVEDVVSIFAFVLPKLFTNEYYPPDEVKNRISPYFLRRLKKDVLKDLPEKIHQEIWLELDDDQRSEYNMELERGRCDLSKKVEKETEQQVRVHIFTLLQKLKQICNFAPNKSESPKTAELLNLIEIIDQNKEKVLIFSQYTEYGIKKLEEFFQKKSIKYVPYYGGISDQERNRALHSFKTNPDITVFLGSVRAAGFGLTLTEASYVIHFDHWWNPAVMWQAEDRAHRPGQENKLNVYSFWMRDTIEERIKQKLYERGLLIESVIDSLAVESIEEMITTAEWLDILGVKMQPDATNISESDSIERILDYLSKVSPFDFENIVRDFFIKQGYINAKVTQRSHDGGIDVFGSRIRNGVEESFIAQCKRTSSVGVDVARELLGILAANPKITNGFIITSGNFTKECLRFTESISKLNLINGITFANFIKHFKLL